MRGFIIKPSNCRLRHDWNITRCWKAYAGSQQLILSLGPGCDNGGSWPRTPTDPQCTGSFVQTTFLGRGLCLGRGVRGGFLFVCRARRDKQTPGQRTAADAAAAVYDRQTTLATDRWKNTGNATHWLANGSTYSRNCDPPSKFENTFINKSYLFKQTEQTILKTIYNSALSFGLYVGLEAYVAPAVDLLYS